MTRRPFHAYLPRVNGKTDFKNVVWAVEGPDLQLHIASARYMAHIPAATLGGRVVPFHKLDSAEAWLRVYEPRALIMGKPFSEALIILAEAARRARIPVASVLADWHFDKPEVRQLVDLSDRLVVQTAAMAQAVKGEFGVESDVIEECFEGPRGKPRFRPGRPLQLAWYGHSNNLDTLSALASLKQVTNRPMALWLVTDAEADKVGAAVRAVLSGAQSDINVKLTPWTIERQFDVVAWSDIVLIPSAAKRDKMVKGHNRLVQAIHGGRLALAHPLPPYLELAEYCWIGEDMAEGISWALDHVGEAQHRIRSGQDYIDQRFSPEAVGRRWAALIETMTA